MTSIKRIMALGLAFALPALAVDFDVPPAEPAAASVSAELVSGPNYHLKEPVESDGLMHHYVVQSKFGDYPAYGEEALHVRLGEVAALTHLSKTNDIDVVVKSVGRGVKNDVKSVEQFAKNPIKTVTGIPRGIGHLFHGYQAQAEEVGAQVKKDTSGSGSGGGGGPSASKVADTAKRGAVRYADRYLGISRAERMYYAELKVDPYTDNAVLRKAISHVAKVDAATSLGMHFVGVPGVPYLGDVQRAMNAIYNEDPAVIRKRQRETLTGYGLKPEEIAKFENTLLLSPTKQAILMEDAKFMDGVAGRDELFRHASTVTTPEEVQVFVQSTRLLARIHAQRPLKSIVAGLRIPTAQAVDGHIVIAGAFDSVYWTEDVAGYQKDLQAALPAGATGIEIWLSGPASPRVQEETKARGWELHDGAAKTLPDLVQPAAKKK